MLIDGPSASIKCNSDKNYVSFDQVHNSKYLECETVWIFLKLLCSFSICMTSVLRKYLNFVLSQLLPCVLLCIISAYN